MASRRVSRDRAPGWDVSDDSRLGGDAGAPRHRQVSSQASLASQQYVILDRRAAPDPDLSHDHAAGADSNVVPDLDQIVDLRSRAHHRVVQHPSVDGGVGTHLHIALDDATADMGNASRSVGGAGESESGASDPRSSFQHYTIPQVGSAVNHRLRADPAGVSQDGAVFYGRIGSHPAPLTDSNIVSQYAPLLRCNPPLPPDATSQAYRGMDPPGRSGFGGEHPQDVSGGGQRIGDDDASCGACFRVSELGWDEHRRRASALKIQEIAGRDKKRQIAGPRSVQGGHAGDRDVAAPDELTADEVCHPGGGEGAVRASRRRYWGWLVCSPRSRRIIVGVRSSARSAAMMLFPGDATSKINARFRSARTPSMTV